VPESAAEQAELCFGAVGRLLADVGMSARDGARLRNIIALVLSFC
jgi:hypothetical protein